MIGPDGFDALLAAARPRAMAALLRYFRDLDIAEDAFQNACLRALTAWPKNGPPRDATAWLILVGRNAQVDSLRRRGKTIAAEVDAVVPDGNDEPDMIDRLDQNHYRDDILRLLFTCCHPDLSAAQQIAVALRIVSGLTVPQIARAFLVSEAAMEQRITRAKMRIARAGIPFETPGRAERAERLAAVGAMLYLVFNEGYTAADPTSQRAVLCDEAIRLCRLLLQMFPAEPELMGLLALMLLQHSRTRARFDPLGAPVLLDRQDRQLWDRALIGEALVLIDKAMRHRLLGAYQIQAAIAALHARATRSEDTDWRQIEKLYEALEHYLPSPVTRLNHAAAVAKVHGAQMALEMIEPLSAELDGYFYFHGMRGALLKNLGRSEAALQELGRAIALAGTTAEAMHIRGQIDLLEQHIHSG